jgi:hypothetical protein
MEAYEYPYSPERKKQFHDDALRKSSIK